MGGLVWAMVNLTVPLLALLSGLLLGLMVFFNGSLAKYINPLEGSLVVHLIGFLAAIVLAFMWRPPAKRMSVPWWTYATGIFGGIAVAIVGICVNSPLGVGATVGLMVLGQVLYGWVSDACGWFGQTKRLPTGMDFLQALFVLAGVGVLIYG